MKTRALVIIAFVVLTAAALPAQDRGIGVGIIAGDPTGLSAKLWISGATAIDAAAAWSFIDTAAFHLHADYLMHAELPVDLSAGTLMLHFGAGARVKLEDETRFGIRVPLGLAYWFGGYPIEIFLEVAPVLDLVPATEFDFNGGVGIRYFFARSRG